jgi:hypothetical protein
MTLRPRIARTCPARANLTLAMEGAYCRLCRKTVHNLDAMSATQRCALFASAREEVCVSYRMPASLAAAALGLAALPAAAQTPPTLAPGIQAERPLALDMEIIVGGARRLTAEEMRQLRREAREERRRERQAARAASRRS